MFFQNYKRQIHIGQVPQGSQSEKYKALESVADKLVFSFGYHEDILFLTDDNSESLYPFLVAGYKNNYNKKHLCAISPLIYDCSTYKDFYNHIMNDFPFLSSLFYVDIEEFFDEDKRFNNMKKVNERMTSYFEIIFPRILNGIHKLKEKSYFDFSSMEYVPLTEGYDGIDISEKHKTIDKIDFDITPGFFTLGLTLLPDYPFDSPYDIERTEQLTARIDGKKICNILREQRIRLAQANNILFDSEEYPSIGPCAGTCRKCDSEAAYLREELEKMPHEKHVYPHFDVLEEMENDR